MKAITERLAEIEARTNAVPKGPWVIEGDYPQRVTNAEALVIAECFEGAQWSPSIAEFIAHARTDVPALLAAVEVALKPHEPQTTAHGVVCPRCSVAAVQLVHAPCGEVQVIAAALSPHTEEAR